MSWMAVAIGGSALIGAGASIYGADKAADAQGDAAKRNAELQRLAMNQQLAMFEPNRALGYGATSDLASLYGYALPQYTPLNALISGNVTGQPSYNIREGGGGGGLNSLLGGVFGGSLLGGDKTPKIYTTEQGLIYTDGRSGGDPRYAASIDPVTGTVSVAGRPEDSAALTQYLRTGVMPEGFANGAANGRTWKAIDLLRAQGWTYDPERATKQQAGPIAGANGSAQAGNMSRFFTSPDYQFRRDEGQRNIGNSFAARGGAASGNALRALTEFNSNLASGEFNNYTQRLFQMAGLGGAATSNSANAVQNATQGIQQANTQAGDARASGIMSGIGGVTNALNTGLNNWMLYRGGYFNQPTGQPSAYGPYASGYRFPG